MTAQALANAVLPPAAPVARPSPWIVSRRFDLLWFFGGAVLSLLAVLLTVSAGVSMAAVYWVWLLLFDGPHIAASYTRTYVDRAEWRSRRGLLVGSALLAFGLGPVFLIASHASGEKDLFLLYLGFAALYGVYHVVRQHYGFLALYKGAAQDRSRTDFHLDKWSLYAGCWAPYVWFTLVHPQGREVSMLPPGGPSTPLEQGIVAACVALFAASVAVPLVRALTRFGAAGLARPAVAYLLLTNVSYGLTFFLVARYEPVYAAARGPDEYFLLLNVVTVVFHDVQYVGLVWWHNQNRYAGGGHADDAALAAAATEFGPAAWLNRRAGTFIAACGLFSVGYVVLACWTGVFPHCAILPEMRFGPFTATEVGLTAWWGLALHHYILDQRIWRVSGDPALKRNLGLA